MTEMGSIGDYGTQRFGTFTTLFHQIKPKTKEGAEKKHDRTSYQIDLKWATFGTTSQWHLSPKQYDMRWIASQNKHGNIFPKKRVWRRLISHIVKREPDARMQQDAFTKWDISWYCAESRRTYCDKVSKNKKIHIKVQYIDRHMTRTGYHCSDG